MPSPRGHPATKSRAQRKLPETTPESPSSGKLPGLGATAGVGPQGAAGFLHAHFGVSKMGGYDLLRPFVSRLHSSCEMPSGAGPHHEYW